MTKKFSQFEDGGSVRIDDVVVGIRGGLNFKFEMDFVKDTYGNPIIKWTGYNNECQNYIDITNSPDGQPVKVSADGVSANIDLDISSKGTGSVKLKSDIVYVNQSIAKSDDIENRIEFGPGTMSFIENNVAVFDITDSGLKLASGVRVDNISNLAVDVLTTSILTAAATQEKIDNAIEASNVLAENNFFVGDAFNVAQATSAQGSLNILAGGVTDGQYLGGNGTNVILKQILSTEVQNQHVTVTTATQALAANTSYASNYVGLCVMSLPTTNCPAGSIIIVKATASGATFKITQAAGQSIRYGSQDGVAVVTTVGVTGYVQSVAPYTNIVLQCTSDNTTFDVLSCVPYVNMEVP